MGKEKRKIVVGNNKLIHKIKKKILGRDFSILTEQTASSVIRSLLLVLGLGCDFARAALENEGFASIHIVDEGGRSVRILFVEFGLESFINDIVVTIRGSCLLHHAVVAREATEDRTRKRGFVDKRLWLMDFSRVDDEEVVVESNISIEVIKFRESGNTRTSLTFEDNKSVERVELRVGAQGSKLRSIVEEFNLDGTSDGEGALGFVGSEGNDEGTLRTLTAVREEASVHFSVGAFNLSLLRFAFRGIANVAESENAVLLLFDDDGLGLVIHFDCWF